MDHQEKFCTNLKTSKTQNSVLVLQLPHKKKQLRAKYVYFSFCFNTPLKFYTCDIIIIYINKRTKTPCTCKCFILKFARMAHAHTRNRAVRQTVQGCKRRALKGARFKRSSTYSERGFTHASYSGRIVERIYLFYQNVDRIIIICCWHPCIYM